ncbi:MAG: DUF6383 domain-containing protein [Tannerella sp.]|jgi:hypothetical protein|nr:DUF6383 domain-containing protein [Tannerella sp.]
MNKKIFTLLVASLVLLVSAFTVNAGNGVGSKVASLPGGTTKGAYHLKVTYLGAAHKLTGDSVLALDGNGHVFLADSLRLFGPASSYSGVPVYQRLREALWCVDIKPAAQGGRPTFQFKNKEYGLDLSFLYDADKKNSEAKAQLFTESNIHYGATAGVKIAKFVSDSNQYVVGGNNVDWYFADYYNSALPDSQFLAISLASTESKDFGEPNFYAVLAHRPVSGLREIIQLVKVHADSLQSHTNFYKEHLVFFQLVTAAPRILSADDFNSKLGTQDKSIGNVQLTFNPDKSNVDIPNPFTDGNTSLTATKSTDGTLAGRGYVTLKNNAGQYVSVNEPSDNGDGYANSNGKKYLKLEAVATPDKPRLNEFRFVYYPTEDSLIINAYKVIHKSNLPYHVNGDYADPGRYDLGDGRLYNDTIYDALIVRAQTLDQYENKRIITVDNRPSNVRISFNTGDCVTAEDDRTTLPNDLYTIKDSRGYYLTVPVYTGDFTPQWVKVEDEVPLKTPAFHWLVVQVNDGKTSKVHIINREFESVQINHSQLYKTDHQFNGAFSYGIQQEYAKELLKAIVNVNGFAVVHDDPAAKAAYDKFKNDKDVPPYIWEKLYRTSPYLGYKYIADDSLNYYSYSFNHLHGYSNNRYLGFSKDQDISDTTLVTVEGAQFFELILPDALNKNGDEKYGIGHINTGIVNTEAVVKEISESEKIGLLRRRYYSLRVNDLNYWNYSRNDNVICLDRNKRYGFTTERIAKGRELPISKFYLRFTYQPTGEPEYYILLDRIDKEKFEHLSKEYGLSITQTLAIDDNSHEGKDGDGFGVLQVSINEGVHSFAKAEVKTLGNRISTFSLSRTTEPLYRRFNNPALEGGEEGDVSRTLRFHEELHKEEYLVEDRMSSTAYIPGYARKINYLGTESKDTKDKLLGDDPQLNSVLKTHNYAIRVDTAYVNRGTGWIKPQYLLLLDPQELIAVTGCNACNKLNPTKYPIDTLENKAIYGRYLINATDSARRPGDLFSASLSLPARDAAYISPQGNWERLAFVPAIHIGDTLFILKGLTSERGNPSIQKYLTDDGQLDYDALNRDFGGSAETKKTDLGNNKHKDYVFQFRYVYRQYGNDGQKLQNVSQEFLIESETTQRDTVTGRMIAPMQGGWIKIHNEVPVISRGAYSDAIREAEVFNVEPTTDAPLAVETVDASQVTVLSGTGSVSILNASGKSVVISNVLGQIVTSAVLTSDNATIVAPKGVVIVAVEGEDAVKAIVK